MYRLLPLAGPVSMPFWQAKADRKLGFLSSLARASFLQDSKPSLKILKDLVVGEVGIPLRPAGQSTREAGCRSSDALIMFGIFHSFFGVSGEAVPRAGSRICIRWPGEAANFIFWQSK
jgi:hypothetical protein